MKTITTIPRKVRGFRDIDPDLCRLRTRIVESASRVYERYGFEPHDTPVLEYAECLGKYLPDRDTAAEGVYSFRNPDLEPVLDESGREVRDDRNHVVMEHHLLAMRYDLTAPLARLYAEMLWQRHQKGQVADGDSAPLFRRYQAGPVFRFEAKLDPGRYREFWQLDFDTVGTSDVACDAEVCRVLSDALEACGIQRGGYEIKVGHRKLHKGLFERLGLAGNEDLGQGILRVVDKLDKIGASGAALELGKGREDPESGAFIPGLGLESKLVGSVVAYIQAADGLDERDKVLETLRSQVGGTASGEEAIRDLVTINAILKALGYDEERVVFDPSVARGLAYYTGPVFEAVSRLEYRDDKGTVRRFGSICGGGRYDGLVERLLGLKVPATGASIGVDRLAELLRRQETRGVQGPVMIIVMDPERLAEYETMACELRAAGLAAEVYYGARKKLKAQMAYADSRSSAVAVIAGGNEFEKGTVSLKDLRAGRLLSTEVKDRKEWRESKPGQTEVKRDDLVNAVKAMLQETASR